MVPLLILYASQVYVALAVVYLLSHPEMIVSACFTALDSVPNYTAFAVSKMAEQFKLELQARFR